VRAIIYTIFETIYKSGGRLLLPPPRVRGREGTPHRPAQCLVFGPLLLMPEFLHINVVVPPSFPRRTRPSKFAPPTNLSFTNGLLHSIQFINSTVIFGNQIRRKLGELQFYFRKIPLHQQKL